MAEERDMGCDLGDPFYGDESQDAAKLSSFARWEMMSARLGMLKAPEIRS